MLQYDTFPWHGTLGRGVLENSTLGHACALAINIFPENKTF